MTNQELLKKYLETKVNVENSVAVTETSVIVIVSFTPMQGLHLAESDYFVKNLVKKIPALNSITTGNDSISVVMKVPVNGRKRNNTIETICDLGRMALAIISLIIKNMTIPIVITSIADDCKPWFFDTEENEGGLHFNEGEENKDK